MREHCIGEMNRQLAYNAAICRSRHPHATPASDLSIMEIPLHGQHSCYHSRTFCCSGFADRRIQSARRRARHPAGHDIRCVIAVSGAQGGVDGERVDSGGGDRHHPVPPVLESRWTRFHHPREQYRADRRFGGGVDRIRPRRDHAGDTDPRFRPGNRAGHAGGSTGRIARHPDDDSAAPHVDCGAARQAQVSGRHRLRGSAQGGGTLEALRRHCRQCGERQSRRRHLCGLWHWPLVQSAECRVQRLEGCTGEAVRRAVEGRLGGLRNFARAAGRRLHHRAAHRLDHVCRRRDGLPAADPAHQVFR